VWIKITGDGSIGVEYTIDGNIRRETICSYTTNNGGHKITYKIRTAPKLPGGKGEVVQPGVFRIEKENRVVGAGR